jgi:hypothetical protein
MPYQINIPSKWHSPNRIGHGAVVDEAVLGLVFWSRREELNAPSAEYDSAALTLSYTGSVKLFLNYTIWRARSRRMLLRCAEEYLEDRGEFLVSCRAHPNLSRVRNI